MRRDDGAADFQDAVEDAGEEVEEVHDEAHEVLAFLIQGDRVADLAGSHFAVDSRCYQSLSLELSGSDDAVPSLATIRFVPPSRRRPAPSSRRSPCHPDRRLRR